MKFTTRSFNHKINSQNSAQLLISRTRYTQKISSIETTQMNKVTKKGFAAEIPYTVEFFNRFLLNREQQGGFLASPYIERTQ